MLQMSKKYHVDRTLGTNAVEGKTGQISCTDVRVQDVLTFLASTANDMLAMPLDQIDEAVEKALARFSKLIDADRSAIHLLNEDQDRLILSYEWCRPGIPSHMKVCRDIPIASTPVKSQMMQHEPSVMVAAVAKLPAIPMKQLFIDQGIEFLIMVPLRSHQQGVGMIFFELMHDFDGLSDLTETMLPVFAQMVANAIGRKAAEERAQRLDFALTKGGIGTWELDFQSGKLTWDAIMYDLYGLRPGSFGGSYDDWVCMLHPDDRGWAEGALADGLGDQAREKLVFRIVLPTGEIRHIKATATVIHDREGSPVRMIGTNMDVTAEKEAEMEVIRSRERMIQVIEGTRAGTWDWHVQTGETTMNEQWANLIGYTLEEISPTSLETFKKYCHPEDLQHAFGLIQETLDGQREHYECEIRMRHRDGHWVWVLDRGNVTMRDSDGTPLRMAGLHIDITERKRLEATALEKSNELEASNQQLQAMNQQYEATNQQLYAAELQLRSKQALHSLLTTISLSLMRGENGLDHALQKALKMIGSHVGADRSYIFEFTADGTALNNTYEWCAEGIASQQDKLQSVPVAELPWWMSEHSDLQPIFIPDVATLPQEASREKELLESQGIRSLLALPMAEDGEFIGFLGLDWVTRHSSSVREEHVQLLQLAGDLLFGELRRKHSADALQRREQKYRSIFENIQDVYAEVEAGTGLITEVSPSIAQFGYKRDEVLHTHLQQYYAVPEERELLYQALEQTSRLSDFEVHLRQKNGSIRTCAFTVELLQGSNGEPPKVVGTMRDITERASHEAQMKENLQLKNDFISMVSHELRTPLFSILGFSSMLLKDNATLDADTRSEFLSIIHDESTRLSSLIEDVLTISRIDAGKSKYQPLVFNPASSIADVVMTLRRSSKEKGVELNQHLATKPCYISFDKDAFKQVLMNLIGNGIKFTPQSGSVDVCLSQEEHHVLVEVTDTGVGIPAEDLEKIFDKFFRSEHSAASVHGTGLGLAIVKDIVDLHGGKIRVSSRIGQGSTFTVILPLAVPSAGEVDPGSSRNN